MEPMRPEKGSIPVNGHQVSGVRRRVQKRERSTKINDKTAKRT